MDIQKIYDDFGKYDRVVVLTLKNESKNLYGDKLTGQIFYKQSERLILGVGSYENPDNPKLRFYIILKNGISTNLIKKAFYEGIQLNDIVDIYGPDQNESNQFIDYSQRTLPEPLKIKIDGSDNIDLAMLGFYKSRLDNNQKLLDYEIDRYAALVMVYKPDLITKEFEDSYINQSNGNPKKSVLYEKCKLELESDEVKELSEIHKELIEWKFDEVNKLVKSELRKAGIGSKKEIAQFLWLYNFLIELGVKYVPKTLHFGDPLIYVDYESWMHIYLKHVKPLMVGKHIVSSGRTPFQYAAKDIDMLLGKIISLIHKDIDTHFSEKGNVEFTKRAIYYQGDYYTVKISSIGRIETIFKQEKPNSN